MSDEQYTIQELEAHHIQHAVAMAEKAGMKPNAVEEIDFFRLHETSTFVGLFLKGIEEKPIAVVGILHDEDKDYLNLLIVDDNHRKKGLGEKLVKWAVDKSRGGKEEGEKVLQLVASKMGSPLYKRLGFVDLGYTNMYELKGQTRRGSEKPERDFSKQVLSVNMSDIAENAKDGLLWSQARDMLLAATSSTARVLRLEALLQKSTLHLLYEEEASSEKPMLLAWGAVRRFSKKGLVVGPVIGTSIDNVVHLMQEIPAKQAGIASEQMQDSLVIHTDGRSEQEPQLAKSLEQAGWGKVVTLEMLELPVVSGHSPSESVGKAQQYALTDFSHQ